MALVLANRVQETATPNTTVSFTLTGAVSGFQTFAVIGNTNTTYYSATDTAGNWEVGEGTYSTTGPTLTRTTVYASSNSGSAVTFPGTVNVFVTYPSGKSVNLDGSGNVSALGTVSSGTWQGGTIQSGYGGTGLTTFTGANNALYSTGASTLTAGTLPIAAGGTGQITQQAALNALSGTQTANRVLRSNGTNVTFSQVALGTDVSGTLPTANGGTNLSTFGASNRALYSTSASALTAGILPVAAGGSGSNSPTLFAGTNVSISGSWPFQTISSTASAPPAAPNSAGVVYGITNTTAASTVTGAGFGALGSTGSLIWPSHPEWGANIESTAAGLNALSQANAVVTLDSPSIVIPGTGYTNGTYNNVSVTFFNYSMPQQFFEASINITISGGAIVSFSLASTSPTSYHPSFLPFQAIIDAPTFYFDFTDYFYPWGSGNFDGRVSVFFSYQRSVSNTAVGHYALYSVLTNVESNTAVGAGAGLSLTSGDSNTVIGATAGSVLSSGNFNTFVGTSAGSAVSTGGSNTLIGAFSGNDSNGFDVSGQNSYCVLSAGSDLKAYWNGLGVFFFKQQAPVTKSGAGTLAGSDVATQIIVASGTTYSLTFPTAANLGAALGTGATNFAFEFVLINTASGNVTLAANTDFSIVGNAVVAPATSATFKIRKSNHYPETFIAYRV